MNSGNGHKRVLHIEEGPHYFLEPDDELPYRLLRNLGQGGTANVEEVEDLCTGMVFARKIIGFCGSSAERQRLFHNEVKVIRRLTPHHHITQVFATYVGRREIGIILLPVADRGSLETFLQDAHEGLLSETELTTLYNSFGCLASGLQFMHAQKVRHKDIKPQNILVHGNDLIYTDFGSSLDYSAATRSVTTGRPASITRRYAAPELHEWSPRSSKTDVFSLGCVYLEVLSALVLGPLDSHLTPYRDHMEELSTLMRGTYDTCDTWLQVVIGITCQMLDAEPEARLSAEMITSQLWQCWPGAFCEQCCMNLMLQVQVEPSVDSIFAPDTADTHWPGKNLPVAYKSNFRSLETPVLEANRMHGLPFQQEQVSQAEQVSTLGERQLSMLANPSETTSLVPENAKTLWTYPITPNYTSLEVGDGPSSERPSHTRPISFAAEPPMDWSFLFPVAQTSPVPIMGPPSNVADAGRSRSRSPTKFQCPKCGQLICHSELRKHELEHLKPFKCVVSGCKRTEGFTTENDLKRHQRSVHRMYVERRSYQCAVENCRNGHKVWPRKDNFLLHIERMHKNENVADLVKRSEVIVATALSGMRLGHASMESLVGRV